MTSRALVPAAAVLLALSLTGCGGGTPGGGLTGSPLTPSTGPDETAQPAGEAVPCTRDDLDISYAATDNTAGQMHGVLSMTNTAPSACTLGGYPILYLGSGEVEEPVGQQAAFDDTATDEGFTLEPGNVATSNVTITQAGNIEGCDLASTTHLIAAPPLDHAFVWEDDGRDVPIPPTPVCYNDDIGLLTVSPLVLSAS